MAAVLVELDEALPHPVTAITARAIAPASARVPRTRLMRCPPPAPGFDLDRRPGGHSQVSGARGRRDRRTGPASALLTRLTTRPSGSPTRGTLGLGGCPSAPGSYCRSGSSRPGSASQEPLHRTNRTNRPRSPARPSRLRLTASLRPALAPVAYLRQHLGEERFDSLGPLAPQLRLLLRARLLRRARFPAEALLTLRAHPGQSTDRVRELPAQGLSQWWEQMHHLPGYWLAAVRYIVILVLGYAAAEPD